MNFWVATAQTGQTVTWTTAEFLWITINLGCQMLSASLQNQHHNKIYNFLYNFTTELYFSDYFDIRLNFSKSYT